MSLILAFYTICKIAFVTWVFNEIHDYYKPSWKGGLVLLMAYVLTLLIIL